MRGRNTELFENHIEFIEASSVLINHEGRNKLQPDVLQES